MNGTGMNQFLCSNCTDYCQGIYKVTPTVKVVFSGINSCDCVDYSGIGAGTMGDFNGTFGGLTRQSPVVWRKTFSNYFTITIFTEDVLCAGGDTTTYEVDVIVTVICENSDWKVIMSAQTTAFAPVIFSGTSSSKTDLGPIANSILGPCGDPLIGSIITAFGGTASIILS